MTSWNSAASLGPFNVLASIIQRNETFKKSFVIFSNGTADSWLIKYGNIRTLVATQINTLVSKRMSSSVDTGLLGPAPWDYNIVKRVVVRAHLSTPTPPTLADTRPTPHVHFYYYLADLSGSIKTQVCQILNQTDKAHQCKLLFKSCRLIPFSRRSRVGICPKIY